MKRKSIQIQNKIFATIFGSVILILLLFWSYHNRQIKEDEATRKQLEFEVSKQILLYKNGQFQNIDLSKITSFSWDKLFIFGPYTPISSIQEVLGYSWEPSINTILGADTPFNLLVFTYQGEVVRYVDYPRTLGEFSGAMKENGYGPSDAVFIINETGYIVPLHQ